MAGRYDTSFKELVTHNFGALLPWLLPETEDCEVIRLSEELPATLRRADLILRSTKAGRGPRLFLIECQCQYDADLPLDMVLRAALAHRQYRIPVETILLAFTPQAVVPEEYVFGYCGRRPCYHVVNVRHIYDEPAEPALSLRISQLLPLVPAMKPIDGDREGLLSRVLERIIDLSSQDDRSFSFVSGPIPVTDAQRLLMLDQAATFATLHLSKSQVQGIVRDVVERRHYMLDPIRDFPWLRAGYEEGIEKGIEKGMATGMAKSLLSFLAARNIPVDSKLRDRIIGCQDESLLNVWIARAATAKTAGEVVGDN
jgi:hypothetical protein